MGKQEGRPKGKEYLASELKPFIQYLVKTDDPRWDKRFRPMLVSNN